MDEDNGRWVKTERRTMSLRRSRLKPAVLVASLMVVWLGDAPKARRRKRRRRNRSATSIAARR